MSGLSGGGFDKIPVLKEPDRRNFINAAKKELRKHNREGKIGC
jgi:hypothetical protein